MTIVDFPQSGEIGTSLLPTRWDIEIYQGDTFDVIVNFKDASNNGVDLTGITPLMQIKNSTGTVVATPTLTANYNSTNGAVRVFLDTSSLQPGTYSYDLQLTDATSKVRTFIGGKVVVTGDITE